MKNLKNSIHSDFQSIDFDKWKEGAKRTLKNIDLDVLLTKNITKRISIKSIYNKSQVERYFDLEFQKLDTTTKNEINLSQLTDLPCESDLEAAWLIHQIDKTQSNEISISVIIDKNFFLSIAKFRAIRYLLSQRPGIKFTITAVSSDYNKSTIDIENNIIRLTTEAMSAIIGGADKINLETYNSLIQNDDFGRRITDNILVLLENESYLKHVEDPLAGSYLVENMTNQFIVSVESYIANLKDCKDSTERNSFMIWNCTLYKEEIIAQLDSQKKKLVGVNIYQSKKVNIENIKIDENRFASPFEKMKIKVDKINPKVYIANFEEINALQPSVTMSLNTFNIPFQVSGIFELVEDAFNTIKLYDPDIVVVNGNDNIYRILNNMLSEYKLISIDEFSDNSILKNLDIVVSKMTMGV